MLSFSPRESFKKSDILNRLVYQDFTMLFPRFIIFLLAALTLAGCRPKTEPFQITFALNTVCTIFLYDQQRPKVYQDIFDRIHEIESRMSAFHPDSDISRINAAAGIEPVRVHEDVFHVIERAVHFAELSGGAFDPSVGPLVSLWGIATDNPRVPSQEEIELVLPLVNWRNIVLDRQVNSVFLKQPGMALDLGAIAKGYAADEAAAIMRNARLTRGLIDLGGNVLTYGVKQDRTPWRVGLQNPLGSRGAYLGFVSGWDMTVVTSGVYVRYFLYDNVRYHHLFSPFDGYPARSGLLSVTVITTVSMDADALSTAAFVLGYEKGRALIDSLEGVEAVFVFEDMSVRITSGANFTLTDTNFRLHKND
jgi:thiamine biosynthesis lipoprotein